MAPRTILITGGGGGLGKAAAEAFLANGDNVAICDVNTDRLKATEQEWTTTAGFHAERILATVTDVTDETSVQALVDATLAKFGRLDMLINNAGIVDDFSPVADCSPQQWHRVMAVNTTGPYFLCRAVMPVFLDKNGGEGIIINICSIAAQLGHGAGVAYTASKHALLGLSRNTACAYGDKGVYSIAMAMGGMNTNITEGQVHHEEFIKVFTAAKKPMDYEKHIVPLETVTKYLVFMSQREVARAANGACIDVRNNWPDH